MVNNSMVHYLSRVRGRGLLGLRCVALVCCLLAFPVLATDSPELNVQIQGERLAGELSDGTLLAQARIVYHGSHSGFQVWIDDPRSSERQGRYMLPGKQDTGNVLRIKLEKEGWQPAITGSGIVLNSGDEVVTFNVVADGDQTVPPDSYSLMLKAVALLPD